MDERNRTQSLRDGSPDRDLREPVSPLPRAAEVFVPAGTYGIGPHVPTTPYIPPLPPALREAGDGTQLRVVGEDPLTFLAKQAQQHQADALPAPAPAVPSRRFRASAERGQGDSVEVTSPPAPRDPRLASVPPPAKR